MVAYEIECPFYMEKGEACNSFTYRGVLLSICFETILKEKGIIEEDDSVVSMTCNPTTPSEGGTISIETFFIDEIKLFVTRKNYNG